MAFFALLRHQFYFQALSPVYFPPWKAENVLRGMAGMLLPDAGAILRPTWPGAPSGFATPPKPFVIRAYWLDGKRFGAGDRLHFEVLDFAPGLGIGEAFAGACRRMETEGLGPGRGRLRLLEAVSEERTFGWEAEERERVTLEFVAPVEVELSFETLVSRLLGRVNALRSCYQGAGEMAALERVNAEATDDRTVRVERERVSSRTGQRYEIGGRVGSVTYQGKLGPAMPLLRIGEWTGVGGGAYMINW